MNLNPSKLIKAFLDRNIFERIICYLFIAELFVQIVLVFILGGWDFIQPRNKQWVFYGLLALDYIVCYKRVFNLKIILNPISAFAFFLFVLIAHGIFAGIMNGNAPFVILNDTVPLLMLALNALRMQSFAEVSRPIDMSFILKVTIISSAIVMFFGLLDQNPSLGNQILIFPLLLVCLFYLKPAPIISIIALSVLMALVFGELNRTSMAFLLLVSSFSIFIKTISKPLLGTSLAFGLIASIASAAVTIPKDSGTYVRIKGLTEIDLSKRTGSIGERQAEKDAVNLQLEKGSLAQQYFGLGFGTTYSIQLTHEFKKDYNHAHFSWVWFKMRYGHVGYFYLFIFMSALIYNGIYNLKQKDAAFKYVGLLCLLCFLYCFTYVNAVWLLSGLSFLHLPRSYQQKQQELYIDHDKT